MVDFPGFNLTDPNSPDVALLYGVVIGVLVTRLYNLVRRLLIYPWDWDGVRAAFRWYDPYFGEPGTTNLLRRLARGFRRVYP